MLDLQCVLLENFHLDPGTLAKTDIDLILPVVGYFPFWKMNHVKAENENEVFADQVDWM